MPHYDFSYVESRGKSVWLVVGIRKRPGNSVWLGSGKGVAVSGFDFGGIGSREALQFRRRVI